MEKVGRLVFSGRTFVFLGVVVGRFARSSILYIQK